LNGGNGWEFGTCLWAPVYNTKRVKSWKVITQIEPGDIVYHFLKTKNSKILRSKKEYFFVAHSRVANKAQVTTDEPPEPDRWGNLGSYYRVPLSGFSKLKKPVSVRSILDTHHEKLLSEHKKNPEGQFFAKRKDGLHIAVKYVANAIGEVQSIFANIIESQGQTHQPLELDIFTPSLQTPAYPDYTPPSTTTTQVTRKIRDTVLSKKIKEEFKSKCAVCNERITLTNKKYYAEGHHVKPLGAGHDGPDTKDNIIVLCPNHHAKFDYGVIGINPESGRIFHKNISDKWHNKEPAYSLSYLLEEFVIYHYEIILKEKFKK